MMKFIADESIVSSTSELYRLPKNSGHIRLRHVMSIIPHLKDTFSNDPCVIVKMCGETGVGKIIYCDSNEEAVEISDQLATAVNQDVSR